jgi:hypothetical protein
MKKSFKEYLIENKVPFYTLYTVEFPSNKLKKMKPGPEKDKETEAETVEYKKLFTDFLQTVGSMND